MWYEFDLFLFSISVLMFPFWLSFGICWWWYLFCLPQHHPTSEAEHHSKPWNDPHFPDFFNLILFLPASTHLVSLPSDSHFDHRQRTHDGSRGGRQRTNWIHMSDGIRGEHRMLAQNCDQLITYRKTERYNIKKIVSIFRVHLVQRSKTGVV